MDRLDAVAAAELVGADQVIPCHYDTFPPIETDAQAFKADVEDAGFARGRRARARRRRTRCDHRDRPDRGRARRAARRSAARSPRSTASPRPTRVTGEWDFVAIVRVPRHEQLAEVVTERARCSWTGVTRTQTMVAFEVFSAARPRGDVLDRLVTGSRQRRSLPPLAVAGCGDDGRSPPRRVPRERRRRRARAEIGDDRRPRPRSTATTPRRDRVRARTVPAVDAGGVRTARLRHEGGDEEAARVARRVPGRRAGGRTCDGQRAGVPDDRAAPRPSPTATRTT